MDDSGSIYLIDTFKVEIISPPPSKMAEVVRLASGIVTLLATAYKSCQALQGAIDGIRNAPGHVGITGNDL